MLKIKNIHFIGIAGVGMSGIAEVLLNLGYNVSGSDLNNNQITERLAKLGANICIGHKVENINNVDVVVKSSAVSLENVELQAAQQQKIPIISRANMLAELMRFSSGIAVAGTHGKTTTTSLTASLLERAGLEPTYVIGGKLNSLGSNAKLGKGKYFVAEADESDGSFMQLNPVISIVTNIDNDHLEYYDNDYDKLKTTFVEFINKLPFYGFAVLCIDDAGVKSIVNKISRKYLTYGFSEGADLQAFDWQQIAGVSNFKVKISDPSKKEPDIINISLNLPGKHNVLNSLAAIAVAIEVGAEHTQIQQALNDFSGINRRFQSLGDFVLPSIFSKDKQNNASKNIPLTLIDDYGHHPKEVDAVIDAIRSGWQDRRLVMVYQLHRYSRTKALLDDFANVLAKADKLILLNVYSAGEAPISGADSKAVASIIANKFSKEVICLEDNLNLQNKLKEIIAPGDIVLMQGAGDISKLAHNIAKDLQVLCSVS